MFDQLDSRLIVESAGKPEAGQGVTLHHLVGSEVARWPKMPEETMSNIIGGLVDDGTRDEESTANRSGEVGNETSNAQKDTGKGAID